MGLTHVTARVSNPSHPDSFENVHFLVDSGAVYSLVPRDVLERIGIVGHSRRTFTLANGEHIECELGSAAFDYQGRRGDGLVIFGDVGAVPLLGATTLEGFGYVLDPYNRELRPLPMMLGSVS